MKPSKATPAFRWPQDADLISVCAGIGENEKGKISRAGHWSADMAIFLSHLFLLSQLGEVSVLLKGTLQKYPRVLL